MILILLSIGMLPLAFNVQQVKAFGTIYIRADGSVEGTIAIQTADNFTYFFAANIWQGTIVVERSNIIIDASGHTLQGRGSGTGIGLSGISNVTVKNAQVQGFDLGIGLSSSLSNTISGNNVTNNCDGIRLDSSPNNVISGNNVTANYQHGTYLSDSSNNTLVGNIMASNGYNFRVESDTLGLSDFANHVDASNTVDGKLVYYWVDRRDMAVPLDAGYVALVNCTSITVQDLNLTRNGEGVLLAYTTNSTITQNSLTNNYDGIVLVYSSNNSIFGNNVSDNGPDVYLSLDSNNSMTENGVGGSAGGGITLGYASNNVLKNNTMAGNAGNFYVYGSSVTDYLNDVDASNTVDGKPVYYWVNEKEKVIPLDAGYVALVGCTGITVQNLNLRNDSPDILLAYTTGSTIAMNTITPIGGNGIYLWYSSGNSIIENEMMNSIELDHSSNCNITRNTFANSGLFVASSFGNAVKDNTVNGKPLVYLEGVSSDSVTDAGQVILVNCNNILVKDLILSGTVAGLLLQGTNNTAVTNNTITEDWSGIWLGESSNNTVVANNIENNRMGLLIYQSSRNSVYHNNFVENHEQVHVTLSGHADSWDNGYPSGGNYWGGFNPADGNKDRIGDVPYNIDKNNTDKYPLIYPFERYESGYTPSPDLNRDGFVNIIDVSTVSRAFGCRPGDPRWNPMADMDMNEIINIIDISKVAKHFGQKVLLHVAVYRCKVCNAPFGL
jgi:parallel beta-helix repeat protein